VLKIFLVIFLQPDVNVKLIVNYIRQGEEARDNICVKVTNSKMLLIICTVKLLIEIKNHSADFTINIKATDTKHIA